MCSRGSGADNIRNVTGTPTAGIDPQELIDTRPYAREWHFHILNDRSLYGIPRKFNVGFDGAGIIPVLEDTNDIGFQAVEVKDGFGVEPGVWFRLMLGGITGHKDFARETGVIVKPADATKVADAVVRVFIDHGDRTNRTKARLKYVLDAWGFDKFLGAMEEKLGRKLMRAPAEAIAPRPPFDRLAHIGVHPQKQTGLELDRRRASGRQDDRRADARPRRGRARFRRRRHPSHGLAEPPDLRRRRRSASRPPRPRSRRSGSRPRRTRSAPASSPAPAMSAASSRPPTPSATPRRSRAGARRACSSTARSTSISPAATIPARSITSATSGSSACKVQVSEDGDQVEGYHILVGGGFGPDAALGREIYRDVKAEDAPQAVERMLKAYLGAPRLAGRKLSRLHAPPRGRCAQDHVRQRGRRMTQTTPPPIPTLIPDSAPFTPEQRTWLNGFFAGLLSLDGGVNAAVAGGEPRR